MMRTKQWLFSIATLLGSVAPAVAQDAAKRCSGPEAVGYVGIEGVDCNCTITSPGSSKEWSFRTEPRITSLNMESRAGSLLKIGDVITHVNGKLITTREGAQELADVEPGENVVLTIRRSGHSMNYALTAQSTCPDDTRLLGIYAPTRAQGKAPTTSYSRINPTRPAQSAPTPRGSFGMGLSCSGKCSMQLLEKSATFSKPPEVYSIERGGPADKAGVRRGDVLTHINGNRMDSREGGELFANVRPGEQVRFTIQRGSERKTIAVRAASGGAARSPSLAQSSESLVRARESLTELQREQAQQLRKLQEELRRTQQLENDKLQELHRDMLRVERDHHEKLTQLARELTRTDQRMRAAMADSVRAVCPVPMTAPAAGSGSSRTLRYTGTLGNSEIEVRGANPVSVTENRDEVVITTGGTVVRVKKSK